MTGVVDRQFWCLYICFYSIQSGRVRKCSIVQEEDDDEDETERDDCSLNRRGSRSEGRINIAVQDRIAESEMLKKDMAAKTVSVAMAPTRGLFDGIAGVTLLTANDNNLNYKLGRFRYAGSNMRRPTDFRPRTAAPITTVPPTTNDTAASQDAPNALPADHSYDALNACRATDPITTKFLTDSSTISIPIQSNAVDILSQPKFKTMPSPTRANTILPGTNCLNEIFEEGTDVGSSDTSTTTTPRPVARHTTFTNARATTSAAGGVAGGSTQRRTKFHKTRTASCSSSDDDDSENRKKRAHKIVDSHHKNIQTQRRDSNDDSSDSQDPGSGATAGSNSSSQYSIQAMVGATYNEQGEGSSTQTNGGGSTSNGTQKGGYRRHRNGRRRTGETRLRESQSLNRITEVQESESPLTLANQHASTVTNQAIAPTDAVAPIVQMTPTAPSKPPKMGFSARLFHGFRKSDAHAQDATAVPSHNHESSTIHANTKNSTSTTSINSNTASTDDAELASEIAKAIKSSAEGKSSAAAKKLKLLGKYFQVISNIYQFIC